MKYLFCAPSVHLLFSHVTVLIKMMFLDFVPEYYDDDEYDYGHSYEDRYCISPSTGRQYISFSCTDYL